jgi:hypothetical protein
LGGECGANAVGEGKERTSDSRDVAGAAAISRGITRAHPWVWRMGRRGRVGQGMRPSGMRRRG